MPLAYPVSPQSRPRGAQTGHMAWASCWVFEVLQAFIALMLLGLGSTLFFASGKENLCIAYCYPLWGAVLYVVAGRCISSTAKNSLRHLASCSAVCSCLGSLVGAVLLTLDVIRISSPGLRWGSVAVLLHCERSGVPSKHCRALLVYELGLLVLMIILTVLETTLSSLALSHSMRGKSGAHPPVEQVFQLLELQVRQPVAGPSGLQVPSGLPPPYSKGKFSLSPQGV